VSLACNVFEITDDGLDFRIDTSTSLYMLYKYSSCESTILRMNGLQTPSSRLLHGQMRSSAIMSSHHHAEESWPTNIPANSDKFDISAASNDSNMP
jgi:hypothetical protein